MKLPIRKTAYNKLTNQNKTALKTGQSKQQNSKKLTNHNERPQLKLTNQLKKLANPNKLPQ